MTSAKAEIVEVGNRLDQHGLAPGASGNLSVRTRDGWIVTPTSARLGQLTRSPLSVLDADGHHISGPAPTKEVSLHLAMYRERTDIRAVAHVHSPFAVAVSVLPGLDVADALPALTAYHVMVVGRLPLIPYFPPGDPRLADGVSRCGADVRCCLLANHGSIACAGSLAAAADALEEIEQTARIWLTIRDQQPRPLTVAQQRRLTEHAKSRLRG